MGVERVDKTVERLLGALGLGAVAAQARLARSWGDIVGPFLASKTSPARLKAGVLTVSVVSPAWAQEVSLSRNTILERIDAVLGPGAVRELRFGVGPVQEDMSGAEPGKENAPAEEDTGDPASRSGPEGIEKIEDPEMRGIFASLSRKAEKKGRSCEKGPFSQDRPRS